MYANNDRKHLIITEKLSDLRLASENLENKKIETLEIRLMYASASYDTESAETMKSLVSQICMSSTLRSVIIRNVEPINGSIRARERDELLSLSHLKSLGINNHNQQPSYVSGQIWEWIRFANIGETLWGFIHQISSKKTGLALTLDSILIPSSHLKRLLDPLYSHINKLVIKPLYYSRPIHDTWGHLYRDTQIQDENLQFDDGSDLLKALQSNQKIEIHLLLNKIKHNISYLLSNLYQLLETNRYITKIKLPKNIIYVSNLSEDKLNQIFSSEHLASQNDVNRQQKIVKADDIGSGAGTYGMNNFPLGSVLSLFGTKVSNMPLLATLHEENWACINVWVPRDEEGRHLGTLSTITGLSVRVGHVSLGTKDCYISLWPNDDALDKKTTKKGSRSGSLLKNYDQDVAAEEGKGADFRIVLYKLNISRILDFYNRIEKNVNEGSRGWNLLGPGLLNPFNQTDFNCATVVYYALKEGGIFLNYNVNRDFSRDYFIANPNNVLKMITNAKQDELEQHPECRDFYLPFDRSNCPKIPTLSDVEPEIKGRNIPIVNNCFPIS